MLTLIFICLGYFILILSFSSYVPMWDAWENYVAWIYNPVISHFNLTNIDFGGHSSQLYFFILSIGQIFDIGNQYLLHLTNAVLTTASIAAFYGIVNLVFPDIRHQIEVYLLTFLYAFYPIIVGNSLHTNPDFGLLVFLIIFLYFILKGRTFLAVLSAIPMIFSKEPGFAIYVCTVILYFVLYF